MEQENNLTLVTRDRYEAMVEAEARLSILADKRIEEVSDSGYVSLQAEDFILGQHVVDAVKRRIAKLKEPMDE